MVHREVGRLTDWRSRLAAEMDRQRNTPFVWGKNDCVYGMARGVVIALTGEDPLALWAASYKSEAGARRALKDMGFTSLEEALAAYLPKTHPDRADIGDLALVPTIGPLRYGVGVIDVSAVIVMTPTGHGFVPRDQIVAAFSVG